MIKKLSNFSLAALCITLIGCGNAETPTASPAYVPQTEEYQTQEWLEYFWSDESMPWEDEIIELELPEFPGVIFQWDQLNVVAITKDGETALISGMPVWSVYLSDLNGDGLPEFCAMSSWGSGFVNERIHVYDYAAGELYTLDDRFTYDYALRMQDGQLQVVRIPYFFPEETSERIVTVGELALVPSKDEEGYCLALVNEAEMDIDEIK